MTNDSNPPSLFYWQRVVLLISSFVLAILLFFLRGGLRSNDPLDVLARKSLEPDIALANGLPTVIEFYADWCEVCREMAPSMIKIEKQMDSKVDIVLLNVDNIRWQDLIDKYEVKGIPQLNFFDSDSNPIGKSIGLQSESELQRMFEAVQKNQILPDLGIDSKISDLSISSNSLKENIKSKVSIGPRSHD